jgi:hypothetical protein
MRMGKRLCVCGHKTWEHDVPTILQRQNGPFEVRKCLLCGCMNFKYERKNPAAVALGKLGGASKSRKKVAAARKNGKLGGRPKKVKNNA